MDPTDWENPDDWELINDDGFVHKRKKQRRQDSLATSSDADQPRKNLRERKRKLLLKLREKYLREIGQWGRLSTTLKEMEANSQTQFQAREGIYNAVSFIEPSSSEECSLTNSTHRRLVNDLLFQVKAQEAIIHGVSHLCDVAEALCSAREERLKQQFIDLLIWESSPCELVAGLTD